MGVVPEWVHNDPDLPAAWALDCSVTIVETAANHRLDGKLAKIGEEWSLGDCFANAGRGKAAARAPPPPSAFARGPSAPHNRRRKGTSVRVRQPPDRSVVALLHPCAAGGTTTTTTTAWTPTAVQ